MGLKGTFGSPKEIERVQSEEMKTSKEKLKS